MSRTGYPHLTLPPSPPEFSFFVPFFNERESLPIALDTLLAAFAPLRKDGLEVILVDDGSSDGSESIADEYAVAHPVVRVVRHPRNLGYGRAMCTGFRACRGQVVGYTDADLPADPLRYVEALEQMDGIDLLLGYPTEHVQRRHRRVYTAGFNALVRVMFGVHVRNINFSFKLLRRRIVDRLTLNAQSGFVDAQIVIEAHRAGAVIREIPIVFQPRRAGTSHFDSPLAPVPTAREAFSWWLRTR